MPAQRTTWGRFFRRQQGERRKEASPVSAAVGETLAFRQRLAAQQPFGSGPWSTGFAAAGGGALALRPLCRQRPPATDFFRLMPICDFPPALPVFISPPHDSSCGAKGGLGAAGPQIGLGAPATGLRTPAAGRPLPTRLVFGIMGTAGQRAQHAGIAQLVVQLICNQQVGGSNPSASSILKWAPRPRKKPGCKAGLFAS